MKNQPQHGKTRYFAFSLIELILVMTILSVTAAIAVPRYAEATMRYRAKAAASRIKHDMNLARSYAVTTRKTVSVAFDTSLLRYAILPNPLDGSKSYIVDLSLSPYEITGLDVDFDSRASFSFNGFGMPSSDGLITAQSGSHYQKVYVLQNQMEASTP